MSRDAQLVEDKVPSASELAVTAAATVSLVWGDASAPRDVLLNFLTTVPHVAGWEHYLYPAHSVEGAATSRDATPSRR